MGQIGASHAAAIYDPYYHGKQEDSVFSHTTFRNLGKGVVSFLKPVDPEDAKTVPYNEESFLKRKEVQSSCGLLFTYR